MSLLEVTGLTKRFGGLVAVEGVDMNIDKGEIVGIVGPNGAGKTTIFNTLSGVLPPTSGKVVFKGEDITGLKPHKIARKGLVRTFQLTAFFGEMTTLENVIVGYHLNTKAGFWRGVFDSPLARNEGNELRQKANDIIDFLGLTEVKNSKARSLPHGHQRTLGVAMALAADPELLLLDEPVTGMLPTEGKFLMGKLKEIQKNGMAILLVEHNMKLVMETCERLYVINFGKKIAEGLPEKITKDEQVIEAYLGAYHVA